MLTTLSHSVEPVELIYRVSMVFSDYTKLRILSLTILSCVFRVSAVVERLLLQDGIRVSKQGVRMFLKRYASRRSAARAQGPGFPPKISPAILQVIQETMREDDETIATQLQAKLAALNVYVSLGAIWRSSAQLGWIYRGSAYCQLIHVANKRKRLEFAVARLHDNFDDVICSNETTVQVETHRCFCYRKEGEKPCLKPRPKHPIKVPVWAGISKKGPTAAFIFEVIMDVTLFCNILCQALTFS